MVKGISKQVIVVHNPQKDLFDQAIFILSDDAVSKQAVTDDVLLREAKKLIQQPKKHQSRDVFYRFIAGACAGALLTGIVWVCSLFL